ncbi:restriction endonuclease subunit S [Chryseobacterium gallinarum]|uniref:Restriction endonuclease subunit S n=1 Tax=Chryseobacterium gallinarum TaxID=1324352 RepID=A0ABX6KL40_CHRGL|nr:restriction endonuclease subunit S [Chryseobacterium gallinarum]QIY89369.1 restriction endonuclease subunit S [Chryseobacterium gallinarum]
MQRYEKYKDSGMDWIGEIPEHWEIRRIKTLFKEINERSFDGLEDLLSVSQYTGVTRKNDKVEEGDLLTNASTLEGYKIVRKGDLVSNIMLAWNGSLGFSPYNGITSPAYSIYRLKDSGEKQFFHYLFRTEKYKAEFKRQSSGVIESRLRLYSDDFFGIFSIVPPSEEQQTIAIFLDDKTSKIDQTIAIKEKEIELLKERRQIIIQKAVTKGLDDTVKLKDSGVDWIGEIPEHWEVRKLKFHTRKIGSGITPSGGATTYLDKGIPLLRSQNVYFDRFEFENVAYISEKTHNEMSNSKVKKNDILLNITGGSIGRCNIFKYDFEANVNQHVCIVRPKNINPNYLNSLLRSSLGQFQVFYQQQGGGREGLNFQNLKNFYFPISPLAEQAKIVSYLEKVEEKIAKAISIKQQEIEKLKEYKMVLIDNVVTGKMKVS